MDNIGNKRPNCQICNKVNSAMMVINGKLMCSECIMKYKKWKEEKAKNELEEFHNANI